MERTSIPERMSGYRFCRTDDIALLVDALNRCWSPYFPDQPPMTPAAFKRSIRDLQVWCSSCMVAFAGSDPIAVLVGAKRADATLVHKIAVHPEHRRQGHGRHLLESLASKLAILGPPRIVTEVPDALGAARELFRASGYIEEAVLTDYVFGGMENEDGAARGGEARFVIPVTLGDLAANGLLGEDRLQTPWHRSRETLAAMKEEIQGIAVASEERIEAYLLYTARGEILALRSFGEDRRAGVDILLSRLGEATFRYEKVHPAEFSSDEMKMLGFRPVGSYRLYTATAHGD
jgi:GNAT superfamily N-acetyltransferase